MRSSTSRTTRRAAHADKVAEATSSTRCGWATRSRAPAIRLAIEPTDVRNALASSSRAGSLTRTPNSGTWKVTSSGPAQSTRAHAAPAAAHAPQASHAAATTTMHAHGHPGLRPGVGVGPPETSSACGSTHRWMRPMPASASASWGPAGNQSRPRTSSRIEHVPPVGLGPPRPLVEPPRADQRLEARLPHRGRDPIQPRLTHPRGITTAPHRHHAACPSEPPNRTGVRILPQPEHHSTPTTRGLWMVARPALRSGVAPQLDHLSADPPAPSINRDRTASTISPVGSTAAGVSSRRT